MTDLCCREVSEFLMDFFDKALEPDVQEGFDAHVAACDTCRTYLEQYRDAIIAGQLACRDDGVDDCPEDLVRAVMTALGKEPKT